MVLYLFFYLSRLMKNLKKRWGIESNFQFVIIFLVFAINGSLSAKISSFAMDLMGINNENTHWIPYYILLLLLVLPLYPFMLLFFGYLFGQSNFFYPFSKKMIRSMGMGFFFRK